jgi:enoyl-CoA hydratase/carnithine racemase
MIRAQLPPALAARAVLQAELYDPVTAREAGLVDEVAAEPRAVALARLAALARAVSIHGGTTVQAAERSAPSPASRTRGRP